MPPLGLPALNSLLKDMSSARRNILIGLDFDGTLAPIAAHPSKARLPEEVRRLLARLAAAPRARLAFMSGRGLANVRRRIGLAGAHYSGNHGLEVRGPGLFWVHRRARRARAAVKGLSRALKRFLGPFRGAFVEDKGLTLSVHYRALAAGALPALRELVSKASRPYAGTLVLSSGKKTFEMRPDAAWDKGRALLKIARSLGGRTDVLFMGDDRTDEDGFRSLGKRAVTVRVGPAKESAARFILSGRRQVRPLLRLLCALYAREGGRRT